MSKFITGAELENAIRDIIWEAKETLLIVSPFIKLDEFFKKLFEHNKSNSRLHLLIVFGKNAEDKSRSFNSSDFEFFKAFPYVSIIYVQNLHAKYYGNETKGVITSINLYDYSFKNNIEFGVFNEVSLLNKFTQNADQGAWAKCMEIAEAGDPVFIKRPVFKKKMIAMLGKDYLSSSVLLDNTEAYFNPYAGPPQTHRKLPDFPLEMDVAEQSGLKPTREQFASNTDKYSKGPVSTTITEPTTPKYSVSTNGMGYCIRTGQPIPFDISRPMSDSAYRTWSQFANRDYPESYCHFSGEPSNGDTSFNRPILKKNWKRAQEVNI